MQKARRQTPAPVQSHSIHGLGKSGGFGTSGTYGLQLPLVSEEDDGSASDNEDKSSGMSSAAQAAALSAFLSVNSSDSGLFLCNSTNWPYFQSCFYVASHVLTNFVVLLWQLF